MGLARRRLVALFAGLPVCTAAAQTPSPPQSQSVRSDSRLQPDIAILRLAALSGDQVVSVARAGTLVLHGRGWTRVLPGSASTSILAVSPDGERFVTASPDRRTLQLRDQDGTAVATVGPLPKPVAALRFGRAVIVAMDNARIVLLDPDTQKMRDVPGWEALQLGGPLGNLEVIGLGGDGKLALLDPTTQAVVGRMTLLINERGVTAEPLRFRSLLALPGTAVVATLGGDNRIWLIAPRRQVVLARLALDEGRTQFEVLRNPPVAMAARGGVLATAWRDGSLCAWRIGDVDRPPDVPDARGLRSRLADYVHAWVAEEAGGAAVLSGGLQPVVQVRGLPAPLRWMEVEEDGSGIWVHSGDRGPNRVDLRTGGVTTLPHRGPPITAVVLPPGRASPVLGLEDGSVLMAGRP